MVKKKLPEVCTVIEFDRLSKNHFAEAYLQLVPTSKRLIRNAIKNKSEVNPTLQEQKQLYHSSDYKIINMGNIPTEMSIFSIPGAVVLTQPASDDTYVSYEISMQKRKDK